MGVIRTVASVLLTITLGVSLVATSRFPTATTVLRRLSIALMPFVLLMFVLVQGLTRKGKGWAELFANGWSLRASHTGAIDVAAGIGTI